MSPELLAHLTPEERAAWDACAAATAPPWHLSADRQTLTQTNHVTRDVWTIPHTLEDMDFIAAARHALPVALRTIAILRAELAAAQATPPTRVVVPSAAGRSGGGRAQLKGGHRVPPATPTDSAR